MLMKHLVFPMNLRLHLIRTRVLMVLTQPRLLTIIITLIKGYTENHVSLHDFS